MKLDIGIGIVIGIPTRSANYPVPISWAWSFKSMAAPMNYNAHFSQIVGKPVAEARNEIVAHALSVNARYVFFLGDDVVCPPHTLRQLIYRMEHHPEIGVLGGVYCSKTDPPAPLVFRGNGQGPFWDWKVGEFFEVTGLGMDCTMIRSSLFKEMKEPYFKTIDVDQYLDNINSADQWTEDLYFLKKVQEETKSKIYCDSSVICEHHDVFSQKKFTLRADSKPMKRHHVEGKTALDIGCGELHRHDQFKGYDLVRVDIRDECSPDFRCDVRQLPFSDESFDIVFSSHVLEHFNRGESDALLAEWCRVVKSEGEICIIVPDIEWAADRLKEGIVDKNVLNVLYGGQSNPFDFHQNGYTQARLTSAIEANNFTIIATDKSGYNLMVKARRIPVEVKSNGHNNN